MATLQTPPNPAPTSQEPGEPPQPIKVQAGRYGELDQHELVRLLDSFDDERSRGRFRESIYVSIFVYLALAWLVIFGPRVLFHQGRLITIKDSQHDKTMTVLDMPKDLAKLEKPAPKPLPKIDNKTMDALKAARRTPEPPRPQPSPAPLPATPQPQPPAPQPAAAQPPPPPAPTPQPKLQPIQPQPNNSVPDAPKPNFNVSQSAGDSVRNAARNAAGMRGGGGVRSENHAVGQQGASSGVEVLSDMQNVDFGPYLKHLLAMVKQAWYPLIPEECYPPLSKEGTTLIRFTIQPNGVVSAMHLDDSTHDRAIDKAAWGSITEIGQFPPLPAEFKGPNLELRIQFIISRNPPSER